jgi:hypothetical protein
MYAFYMHHMETLMIRDDLVEAKEHTMARFLYGMNYPIKRILEFQPYNNIVELLDQARKAERQVQEDIMYSKNKYYYAPQESTTPTSTSAKLPQTSTYKNTLKAITPLGRPSNYTNTSKVSTRSSNITCYKCGGKGNTSDVHKQKWRE